jgi:hypothetical protein
MTSYLINLFRWHFNHKESLPHAIPDDAKHFFYTCNVGEMRASFFQCEEAVYPSSEQPAAPSGDRHLFVVLGTST